MEQGERFDTWGIAEVMGHKRFAGRITEQTIAGAALVRVDVPEVTVELNYLGRHQTMPAYTKLVGIGSIYCITPTTEEVARRAAAELAKWENASPIPLQLPAPAVADPDDDSDEGDGLFAEADDDDFEIIDRELEKAADREKDESSATATATTEPSSRV